MLSVLLVRKAIGPPITAWDEFKHQSILYDEIAYTNTSSRPMSTYNSHGLGARAPSAQHGHVVLRFTEVLPFKLEGETQIKVVP